MNYRWAYDRVAAFIDLLEANYTAWNSARGTSMSDAAIHQQIVAMAQISDASGCDVTSDLLTDNGRGWKHFSRRRAAYVLLGWLGDAEEVARNIGPQGPKMAAEDFHPWVWDHAARLWTDGHPRDAVRAAAIAIFSSHLPTTLGVSKDTAPEALVAAFSLDPPQAGRPRLRIQGLEAGSEDYKNSQQGAQELGRACGKLARNLSAHTAEEHDEQVALEELAMLSRFSRLVEASDLLEVS